MIKHFWNVFPRKITEAERRADLEAEETRAKQIAHWDKYDMRLAASQTAQP